MMDEEISLLRRRLYMARKKTPDKGLSEAQSARKRELEILTKTFPNTYTVYIVIVSFLC